MKFAKYLQDEVVPEWRKAYINYKQGKKHLKVIERALDLLEAQAQTAADAAADSLDVLHPSRIPAYLLNATDLEAGIMVSGHLPPHLDPLERFPREAAPFDPLPPPPSQSPSVQPPNTNATTPILSKGRGHTRNYSAIITPPPTRSAFSWSAVPDDPQNLTKKTDDRPGLGGPSLDEPNISADTTSNARSPGIPIKTGSTGSQFGQSARSQSTHILKSISRRFTIMSPSDPPMRTRTIHFSDTSIESVFHQLLPEERVFFQFLDSQLEMVNEFYREKELEAVTKLKVIKQQLYVANEWKRRYDDKMARAEAEHGWYAAEWTRVRKGFDSFIRADSSVTESVTMAPSKRYPQNPPGGGHTVSSAATTTASGMRGIPERSLRHRDLHGLESPVLNSYQAEILASHGAMTSAYQDELVLREEEENRRQRLNHKVARTRIKAALYEFYRSLEMIKNYKVLNHTGFAKILKKFDKTAGWKASKTYINSKLRPAHFMTSPTVEDLIKETEDVFIDTFERGHRRRGMAKLRIPDSKSQTHHFTSTRIGLYLGLALPLMFQALQAAFSEEMPVEIPYWDSLLLVYGGLFLTILFACLFGINMYVWAKSRINYKFIFEFDPRDNLDFHEYFELPIFLMLLLTLAVYLDFGAKLTAHVATAYWPLILMVAAAAILFCPLPIAHFTSRRWFISSIGRIIASGYYRVEFRDFFLADEMNSLSYSIEQFEFAMCAYSQQWSNLANTCTTSHMWITPLVTGLPAWFRFLQCLRRYRDTLEWFPHLLNAGKYSASLVNLFVYFSYRHYGGSHLKVAWVCVSFLTSIYTFTWDIYMDWGLFRFGKHGGGAYGHPFLRQELVYSRTWVYYMAIVLDFLGRFSWVIRLIPMDVNVMILSFSLAFLEVLRRWQWNFFRLENEHLNNCGQFRAIKDIPLPFHIRVEGESDEEEEEEEDEEIEEADDRRDYEPHPAHDPSALHYDDNDSSELSTTLWASSDPSRPPDVERSLPSHGIPAGYDHDYQAHGISAMGYQGHQSGGSTHGSFRSTASYEGVGGSGNDRLPPNALGRIDMRRKSVSQDYIPGTRAGVGHGQGQGPDFGYRSGPGSVSSSRRNRTNSSIASSERSAHPFRIARSNSFVESAVAEAGFKDSQKEAIESETTHNKFYDRRDFDSKIVDTDLGGGSGIHHRYKPRSSSLHKLRRLSRGEGAMGEPEEWVVTGEDRRTRSQQLSSKRRMSLGARMRSTIFGYPRRSSGSEGDEDDDTE
ncbi:hypothetical protein EDD11_003030 [Mortierella claussenii]|nr:hypothetical protein EDD11_003030 [Mortierella claussenii]